MPTVQALLRAAADAPTVSRELVTVARLNLLDGDTEDLLPGLHAYDGKGHTMGAQFFAVARPKG